MALLKKNLIVVTFPRDEYTRHSQPTGNKSWKVEARAKFYTGPTMSRDFALQTEFGRKIFFSSLHRSPRNSIFRATERSKTKSDRGREIARTDAILQLSTFAFSVEKRRDAISSKKIDKNLAKVWPLHEKSRVRRIAA